MKTKLQLVAIGVIGYFAYKYFIKGAVTPVTQSALAPAVVVGVRG